MALAEWSAGHISSAVLKPLDRLTTLLNGMDGTAPVVHCKGGYRSSIAANLLLRAGFTQVLDLLGGFDAWQLCKLPYTREQ